MDFIAICLKLSKFVKIRFNFTTMGSSMGWDIKILTILVSTSDPPRYLQNAPRRPQDHPKIPQR